MLPSLYLITDRNLPRHLSLKDVVAQAMRGGVSFVQLREKDLPTRNLFALAKEMKELVRNSKGKLLINDRVDIALALQLDGVHLGQSGFPVKEARAIMPKQMILGVSTHSLIEAMKAESDGADFITIGPIYPTASKIKYGPPLGLDTLSRTINKIRIPVYPIGGISLENIHEVTEAGGKRAAVISAIIASSDACRAARQMLEALEKRMEK